MNEFKASDPMTAQWEHGPRVWVRNKQQASGSTLARCYHGYYVDKSPMGSCICTFDPQLVVLFVNAMEPV